MLLCLKLSSILKFQEKNSFNNEPLYKIFATICVENVSLLLFGHPRGVSGHNAPRRHRIKFVPPNPPLVGSMCGWRHEMSSSRVSNNLAPSPPAQAGKDQVQKSGRGDASSINSHPGRGGRNRISSPNISGKTVNK